MTNARRVQIVIGLLLALAVPFCHLGDLGGKLIGPDNPIAGEFLWWILLAAILLYVVVVERRPLSSLGYRRPGTADILLGIGAAIVMFLGTGIIFQLVLPALHLSLKHNIAAMAAAPLWLRILSVTRAAFVEETAFRGYGFERLTELGGSMWLAALVTFVLFTLAHLSGGGWGQVIIAAWGGLILTLLYVWRRNLWSTIIAHWLTDGAAFILLPVLLARHH
ncbi:MAG TPA: type II CAAX endopeptidase family protein [Rhizomicrobium sp.]|jgi:membrane protease YdiL (CAAX protease family)|nr:type II CAAX endopeptidase family protein [Rhizomicrobium sp.]